MDAEVFPGRGTCHPAEPILQRERRGHGHPRIFERSRWIHPLMLGIQMLDPHDARATRHGIERSVALTQCDRVVAFGQCGQNFAETPHSALIDAKVGTAPPAPQGFEFGSIQAPRAHFRSPRGISDFEQIAAGRAALAAGGALVHRSACDATHLRDAWLDLGLQGGLARHVGESLSGRILRQA